MYFKPIIIIIVFILLLLAYIVYARNTASFVGRRNYAFYNYPMFNLGTRQWAPTHLQSYDVRGDVPIGYYPNGVYNQPEWPYRTYYPPPPGMIEPNFYTYEYVNPLQGFYPPIYSSTYSVPFKANNNNSTYGDVKPILNTT
jgi:hypothetical protein